ncbi:MAG: c-type cytochrome [Chloroflexi bacterium]|nr:c-type cytochrome [Chloroflexota bacterium]
MKKDSYDMGRSEPFFPDFLFKEAVAALLAFIVILFLATFQHVPLEPLADPTDNAYVPRPEWYFMFLFQLLKYFPGDLEPLAVVVIPTIGILLLILLPFYDRSKVRIPTARPLATAAAGMAMVGIVYLTSMAIITTPAPTISEALPPVKLTAAENAGKKLFQDQGCTGCHKAGGGPAPDLSKIGSTRDMDFLVKYIKNPKEVDPSATMPPFASMGDDKIGQLSQYLAKLK